MKLTDYELTSIKGGASSSKYYLLLGLGAIITFIIGVVDGYINPNKCNS